MQTYVILRRGGWRSPEELQAAAARSAQVGDEEMSDDIRWIRSYVMPESEGGLGTVCIYQASSAGEDPRARLARRSPRHGDHRGRGHRHRPAGSGAGELSV